MRSRRVRERAHLSASLLNWNYPEAERIFMSADPRAAFLLAEEFGETLLLVAATYNRVDLARRLLCECKVGDGVQFRYDERAWTPLMAAAEGDHAEVLQVLLDEWQPAHHSKILSPAGFPTLASCLVDGSKCHKLLLANGFSANQLTPDGIPMGGLALAMGLEANFFSLLENGMNVKREPVGDVVPLIHPAATTGSPLSLLALLQEGAYSAKDRHYLSSLLRDVAFSKERNPILIAHILLEQGADPAFPFEVSDKKYPGGWVDVLRVASEVAARGSLRFWKYMLKAIRPNCLDDLDENGESLLSHACRNENPGLARALLSAGACCDTPGTVDRPAVVSASIYGRNRALRYLLRAGADVNCYKSTGSALYNAALKSPSLCATMLLQHGADVNDPRSPVPALAGAIGEDNRWVVNLYLEHGAKMDASSLRGFSPLLAYLDDLIEFRKKDSDWIWSQLFEDLVRVHGARHVGWNGKTCLHMAAIAGSADQIRFLIDVGQSHLDALDQDGCTPLMLSCFHGNLDAATVLVGSGCDCAVRSDRCALRGRRVPGLDAFLLAVAGGHESCARLLVERGGVDPDSRFMCDMNCYFLILDLGLVDLSYERRSATVRTLVDLGAPFDIVCKRGYRPVHLAARTGHYDSLFLFVIDHGAEITSRARDGETILHELARSWDSSQWGALDRAVECGADIYASSSTGETALHVAARWHSKEICVNLVRLGIDVDCRCNLGRTPLMLCLSTKDGSASLENGPGQDVAQALLECGAQVEARSSRGLRPLHYAAMLGRVELCRLLLLHGADVNSKALSSGRRALHFAGMAGNVATISFLISRGARIDQCDKKGRTPIFVAALSGNDLACAALLELGADPNILSKTRMTAVAVARRRGHKDVVRVFHAHGVSATGNSLPGRPNVKQTRSVSTVIGRGSIVQLGTWLDPAGTD